MQWDTFCDNLVSYIVASELRLIAGPLVFLRNKKTTIERSSIIRETHTYMNQTFFIHAASDCLFIDFILARLFTRLSFESRKKVQSSKFRKLETFLGFSEFRVFP